jgi:hypothetical protein
MGGWTTACEKGKNLEGLQCVTYFLTNFLCFEAPALSPRRRFTCNTISRNLRRIPYITEAEQ